MGLVLLERQVQLILYVYFCSSRIHDVECLVQHLWTFCFRTSCSSGQIENHLSLTPAEDEIKKTCFAPKHTYASQTIKG